MLCFCAFFGVVVSVCVFICVGSGGGGGGGDGEEDGAGLRGSLNRSSTSSAVLLRGPLSTY